jgi:hypothetical protein
MKGDNFMKTINEVLEKYNLTMEDWSKALKYAQTNDLGNNDVQLHVNEDLDLTIEIDGSGNVKNVYER